MSDENKNENSPQTDKPEAAAPEATEVPAETPAAAPDAPAEAPAAGEEVEYVYEDENGNRIDAPAEGFNAEEYDVVEVPESAAKDDAPAAAPAAAADGKPVDTSATTKRIMRPASSSRRDRNAPKPQKPLTPEQMKKVRARALLVLGLLLLVAGLAIAVIVVYAVRHMGGPKKRVVQMGSYYQQGRDLCAKAEKTYKEAEALYQNGKEAQAAPLYLQSRDDYVVGQRLMLKARQENPGDGYMYIEVEAGKIYPKLRDCRERLFQLEMRKIINPPPEPAEDAAPAAK